MSMVASPPDCLITQAFGETIWKSSFRCGPASYDVAGNRYVFSLRDAAIDVELRTTPYDPILADVLHATSKNAFFKLWTGLEVISKLTQTPQHLMLRRAQKYALADIADAMGVELVRADTASLFIAAGKRTKTGIDSYSMLEKLQSH
jgi:hypothetical protein